MAATTIDAVLGHSAALQHSLDPEFVHCKCPLSISVLGRPCIRVPRAGIMALWPVLPRGHLVSNWLRVNHAAFLEPAVLLRDSDSSVLLVPAVLATLCHRAVIVRQSGMI